MKLKRSAFGMIFALSLILFLVTIPQAIASDDNNISTSDLVVLVAEFENKAKLLTIVLHVRYRFI